VRFLALPGSFIVACAAGESPAPAKVRVRIWNLEWFPNGSAHVATPEVQAQWMASAAAVLRPIILTSFATGDADYEVCARLGDNKREEQ
jgi:hypothetical protein